MNRIAKIIALSYAGIEPIPCDMQISMGNEYTNEMLLEEAQMRPGVSEEVNISLIHKAFMSDTESIFYTKALVGVTAEKNICFYIKSGANVATKYPDSLQLISDIKLK